MSKLLPVVCRDVVLSTFEDAQQGRQRTLEEIAQIVKDENPELASIILGAVNASSDRTSTLYSGLMVYYLLRCQSEVDQLNSQ